MVTTVAASRDGLKWNPAFQFERKPPFTAADGILLHGVVLASLVKGRDDFMV
jgi:hypothetical protein